MWRRQRAPEGIREEIAPNNIIFIGPTGVRATDANSQAEDTQVLTISTPTITIVSVTSTAVTDANAQVNNADTYINMTEDNAVTISGTAAVGFTVHLVITDANGNSFDYAAIPVDGGGHWSLSTSDIGSLDSTTLTLTARLTDTSVSTTNTSYTHDAIAPRIFITNPSEIKKNGGVLYGGSELANAGLTITIRNDTDTTTVGSWTTTTNASGVDAPHPHCRVGDVHDDIAIGHDVDGHAARVPVRG